MMKSVFGIPDAKMSSFSKKYPGTVSVTLKRGQQILATDWYGLEANLLTVRKIGANSNGSHGRMNLNCRCTQSSLESHGAQAHL